MSDLVVMLTAMNLEYEAVRDRLIDPRTHRHAQGTLFEVGRVRDGGCRVALSLVGKGNHPAAVLAERAMAEFAPAAVLFVGVAGALWPDIPLGDVVVASQVYAYHGGTSEDDGLKSRPRAWEIPHAAAQIVQRVIRDGDWSKGLPGDPPPKVHFGPIAAGEVVQDSAVSAEARWIRRHFNDALAIEMEAAGVAQAAHLNGSLPIVVVRGISDRADGSKATTDGLNWQPRAAAHAAAFAIALATGLTAGGTHDQTTTSGRGGRTPMSTNNNIATGNARVGVQAQSIHGNVFGGSAGNAPDPSVDLRGAIEELRLLLRQARHTGDLDEDTYSAATVELDTATEGLAQTGPEGAGKVVLALKRLRGLVAELAEIATRIAGIIGVARGLS
jgi:adenosylhomocysteine nucleosidase